jgi:hypothetical protein
LSTLLVFSAPALLPACVSSAPESESSPEAAGDPAPGDATGSAKQAVTTCGDRNPYGNLYWGELHQHTSYSLDAYSFGTRADPQKAWAFAKGPKISPPQQITIAEGSDAGPGPTVTQPRALDFAALTDHSEWLSVIDACVLNTDPSNTYYGSTYCTTVRATDTTDEGQVFAGLITHKVWPCDPNSSTCAQEQDAWAREVAFANQANDDCNFTALPAYEWTDMPYVAGSGFVTDHRNVIFSSGTVPVQPLDSAHYKDPPSLWAGLSAQCVPSAGCDAVTIPHNSNMSAGVSLQVWDPSASGVALQSRYQVAAEIFQHKGNSECFYDPNASGQPSDPWCQFEQTNASPIVPADFVRNGLETGLQYAADHPLQGNPLQLGIVGATDDHNATPSYVYEDQWQGHVGRNDDTAAERLANAPDMNPGGITGAWAPQNTRSDIFAAIQSRQTFATSGPRIKVRVFQTSSLTACADNQFPKQIVDAGKGVPMGSAFRSSNLTAGGAAMLAIWAWPDTYPQALPDGSWGTATFDSVQVIKAYIDANGNVQESAPYVVSGFPNTGGCKLWVDPSFDSSHRAVYYVRVLQVPTWRWSHFDCQQPGIASQYPVKCANGGQFNRTIQERAWTSPLWYVPGG